jgi:hypothetical protein
METLLVPFMQFAAMHPGPALVLAEWGSPEDPANPQRKAQWITDTRELFKKPGYERFIAVSYWNLPAHEYLNCDFRLSTSAAAMSAFAAMANDPFYSGAVQ